MKLLISTAFLFILTVTNKASPPQIKNLKDKKVYKIIYDENSHTYFASTIDEIYQLDANDPSITINKVKWTEAQPNVENCAKFLSDYECRNHIKVLKIVNTTHLYTCGTYTFEPRCCYLKLKGFEIIKYSCRRDYKIFPSNPKGQVELDLYKDTVVSAHFGGFYAGEPQISILGPNKLSLRNKEQLSVLDNPHFAGVRIMPTLTNRNRRKAYIFLNEISSEQTPYLHGESPFPDDTKIASRVATVCVNDKGDTLYKDMRRISSFEKMTLICSKKTTNRKSVRYQHFTHLRKVKFVENKEDINNPIVVGLFRTSEYGGGSAVCAYNFNNIQQTLDTNKYWKLNNDDPIFKFVYDKSFREECPDKNDFESSKFKSEHPVKAGFIMPKYNTPIYYDEKVDFDTFDISLDLNNEPQGFHIVLTKKNVLQRVFLHTTDLFESEAPKTTVLPQLSMPDKSNFEPREVLKINSDVITALDGGVSVKNYFNCGEYRDNCSLCIRDIFCQWDPDVGKCVVRKTLWNETEKTVCVNPKVPENIRQPELDTTTISTKELKDLRLKSHQLQQSVRSCRYQLHSMKSWATNKMRKYKEEDKNNKVEIKMCHDKLISTNVNCDAAKKALQDKNHRLELKVDSIIHNYKEEIKLLEDKTTHSCNFAKDASIKKSELNKICSCASNKIVQGNGWFTEPSSNDQYLVSEKRLNHDEAVSYCEGLKSKITDVKRGSYLKNLIKKFDVLWTFWVEPTTPLTYNKKNPKCLQLSIKQNWKLVDCNQHNFVICRKGIVVLLLFNNLFIVLKTSFSQNQQSRNL